MMPRSPTITGDELDDQSWSLLNKSVFHFEDAWNGEVPPDIAAFLPPLNGFLRERVLVELIKVDQENRWRRGVRRQIEDYLSDWPELSASEDALVELVSAECLTRSIFDKASSFRELRARFPVLCERVPLARIQEEAECEKRRAVEGADLLAETRAWWRDDTWWGTLVSALPQHFDIRGLLYHHGNAVVYKAYDRERACEVAIGLSYCEPSAEPLASELFLREARKVADGHHPAGLTVHEVGRVRDNCYVSMPLKMCLPDSGPPRKRAKPKRKREHSMSLLQDQQIVRGTYEVERLLGEGAFAEVYRVKHRFLGRQAMKVFKMVGMTIEEIEEMLGEALMLSRMGHPNVVRVFDANVTDTSKGMCGFFTMEYVAGGSLEQFWRSHGNRFVPVETAVELTRQVCRGLALAHNESPPIIHRDIKPQNILVGYDTSGLRARLGDFGLAKHVNPLTLLASARGTRAFKPPEVFRDPQSDSCASDVYALGSTLYLLLTDRLPYAEMGEIDSVDDRCFQRIVIPPSRLNVQVDGALDCIVLRSLAIKQEDRYPDATQMLRDLEKWKPRPSGARADQKSTSADDISKSALGAFSPANEEESRKMAVRAIELSRQGSRLLDAADLMEEAFNKWPDLRDQYEYQLKLWRRGISM